MFAVQLFFEYQVPEIKNPQMLHSINVLSLILTSDSLYSLHILSAKMWVLPKYSSSIKML